LKVRNS